MGAAVGHMVGPPVIGGVVGNIIGERVGEDLIRETGLDREGFARSVSYLLMQICTKRLVRSCMNFSCAAFCIVSFHLAPQPRLREI